jgi:hypothetical protein
MAHDVLQQQHHADVGQVKESSSFFSFFSSFSSVCK